MIGWLIKTIAVRFPFIFAVLVSLLTIYGQAWPFWLSGLPLGAQIITGRITVVLIAIALLSTLRWWREAGFIRFATWHTLLPYLPLILLMLLTAGLNFASGILVTDPALILLGLASFAMGGFIEEALFRGVVLRSFLPGGLLKAALLSAITFSLVHLANLILGQSLGATALQLVRAFLLGFAFVAPLAYTRNIWPLVILHSLINFTSFLGSGNLTLIDTQEPKLEQVLGEIAVFGLLALYGFWLLRRVERQPRSINILRLPEQG